MSDQEYQPEAWEQFITSGSDKSNLIERSIECYREDLPDDNDDMFAVRIFTSDVQLAEFLKNLIGNALKTYPGRGLHDHCNRMVMQRLADGDKIHEPAGLQVNGKNVNPQSYDGNI